MITERGTYRAHAIEVMLGQSSQKGTPYVGVRFQIDEGSQQGQSIRWDGYLTDKTAERTLGSLVLCGWTGDDISVFANGDLNGIDKKSVYLVIEMEPYGGQDESKRGNFYPKVQWINAAPGGGALAGAKMDPAKATAYGSKYKALAMAVKAKAGVTITSHRDPHQDDIDSLPF